MTEIISTITSTLKYTWIKVASVLGFITIDFFFDVSTKPMLLGLIALILFDMITAVYANYKKGHKIESRKLAKTARKIAIYFIIISAGFISEPATQIHIIDNTIIGVLTATELLSILENAGKAGVAVPKSVIKMLEKYKNGK